MDNGDLLRYALQRRQYLVAIWLTLQQRWFVTSFNASTRVVGWAAVALGVALVTFTVVTFARNVVPVLTTPGTLPYVFLQCLLVFVSFNIYVNYFCSTALSRHIGQAPPEYTYRGPYTTNATGAPYDDSDFSQDSSDDSVEEGDGSPWVCGRTQEMSSMAAGVPMAQHTFSSPHRGVAEAPRGPFDTTLNDSLSPQVPVPAVTGMVAPSQPPLPTTNFPGIRVVRVFRGDESADGDAAATVPLHQPKAGVACWRGSTRSLLDCLTRLTRRTSAVFHARGCHRCHLPNRPKTVATLDTLLELEAIAGTAERYPPRLRVARVLDVPRRYCHHCRRLKAPREHHCAICNECVTKMDHHCPWINNCVDAENQRYFVLFVWWLWVGTLLATGFLGYGYIRESSNARKFRRLHAQWKTSPNKAAVEAKLRALHMPYGPAGVLLTSYLTTLAFGVAVIVCLCMSVFLYVNKRLVLENTTAIESIYVHEKRTHVYASTNFAYRSPYDLGKWLNFVDLFSTARDPLVKMALKAEAEADRRATAARPGGCADDRGWRWAAAARRLAQRVAIAVWLTGFPTFRPIYGDGVHYPTFDLLASGELHPLLAE
ncbi:zinc finger domain-like protein [Leishmania major strain Friedlin]|uniref:Palmitoyltransferase n=1 Tax=Leishmania major TaxID=5664 RepID=Q4QC55_LEIMA|nr:zinc finger domain-like protein [Leishmania major strain Friedlin]CAG9573551.1 palmitoyl_acyltransferase_3_putative [Leishmania major strain Friedlin]CAG9573553.1 palmitoyl_acyltransferase_3_putative [Leishmania major strain Friedlin]CAG9573555.1 palmitoyl_acyltransferase_3_putative [Leishmania major strain Friedlin]CAJ04794.1 zinc finger domain-like protein [Leishmania major strain Friedlin]|eukprot:XP_001683093.1 zinc finger domain-like protein [Leishmania major strain Friedlin]